VGHTGMTADEIAENVMQTVKVMSKEFPGGWMNVKNLHLKSLRSPSIPFYLAFSKWRIFKPFLI
jgi:ribosome biogenesis protein UTP30